MLSRNIINIYNDIARKYGNATVKKFRKYEKLEYKKNKLKLDIDFLTIANNLVSILNSLSLNCRRFLIKMLYQFVKSSFVASSTSVIKNSNIFQKKSVHLKTLSTQLSTIDFYILTKSITSYNKKSLQKSLYTQQKKLSSLTRDCNLPIFTANETITNLTQYELSQEESDLLKAGLYFQSNQIKFENPKSSLPLKRFIVRFLTTLNPRKPKVR